MRRFIISITMLVASTAGPVLAAVAPATAPSTAPLPAALAMPATGAQSTITIPGGTSLKVALGDKISSANANVGDTFAVKAAGDVVVDGWVVISKGAGGQGEVVSVDRAGSHGHPGSLGVQMDWIFAADGEKLHLTSQRKTQEGESKAGVSSTMTIVSWAFLGLPGLFAHNWVHGRDIELDGSHPLDAYTADTVHVVASAKSTANDGFAH